MRHINDLELAVRVIGRVQGVGFRAWAWRKAAGLGLRGFVRNEPDGSVVILAAGHADAIRTFEQNLREGPRFARVDRLETIDFDEPIGDTFEIR